MPEKTSDKTFLVKQCKISIVRIDILHSFIATKPDHPESVSKKTL